MTTFADPDGPAPDGATPDSPAPDSPAPEAPASPTASAGSGASGEPCPQCGTPRSGRLCEIDGHDFLAAEPTDPAPAGNQWRVAITADHAYHQRVVAMGGPDAASMAFPPSHPERVFVLADQQLLIGRHSRSRGIDPQIDLAGPPEDPGVSHSHALLAPGCDGGWSVVDLGSSNGTYLNGSTDPLAANTPTQLRDGDRVHIGAWTTLTVQADS